jgi:hypothetical protein
MRPARAKSEIFRVRGTGLPPHQVKRGLGDDGLAWTAGGLPPDRLMASITVCSAQPGGGFTITGSCLDPKFVNPTC